MKKIASATDPLWYKDAVIYEIHVRAFADSNNDGIGDFQGLMSKLDYLQDLGVTCLWLLPFFPSPLRDDGYDIANYVDVNPSYGTLSDFKQFLDAAHQRNMQVMIELVINHTSDQHPWFKAARLAPPGSPQREMYVWSDTDQVFKDARIIFTDTEKSNWTWDETARAYYWHRFFSHQPDLNWESPLVMEEVLKAMRFWLDMGADGIRLDAIPYLVERDGTNCENLPETHAIIKQLRAEIDRGYANRLILAEANQWPADVRPYFGDGDECHMAFHFPLMPRIYMALRQEDRLPITDIMAQTPPIPDSCQWGLFLRNHDELTLEMVTDDERDYMYFAYSADPRMRINVGIRRRLAPLVDNNRRRIELLNSLLLSFPGTPILYYGDEIGMGDNIYLGDRNGVRTPMQWTSDRNAGFSRCDPARLYFPVIMDPIYGYQVVNVEAQQADQSSLLQWTRNMIALRKLFQVFGRGSLSFLNPTNRKILAYLRDLELEDGTHQTVLCVANLSRFAQPVSLDLSAYAGMEPVEMLGYVPFPTIGESMYHLTLAPYSFIWLELQAATNEARPVPEPQLMPVEEAHGVEVQAVDLVAAGWSGLLAANGLQQIEAALPAWLPRQRWFGAKSRRIQTVRVLSWGNLATTNGKRGSRLEPHLIPPAVFVVEIGYFEGAADVYQIPLAISMGTQADEVTTSRPDSVLSSLAAATGIAILHDASAREDFRQCELELIELSESVPLNQVVASGPGEAVQDAGELPDAAQAKALKADSSTVTPPAPLPLDVQPGEAATTASADASTASASGQTIQPRESPAADAARTAGGVLAARASTALRALKLPTAMESRVGSAEQSNTSILYGDKLILKLFRRLQPGENPDVEIGRFLTEVAHFERIAPFLGEMSITSSTGEKTTVAMLQGLVANEGDGWAWFLHELSEFYNKVADQDSLPDISASSFAGAQRSPDGFRKLTATAIDAVALLGRRTAEMHLALSSSKSEPAFAPEKTTKEDLEIVARQIEAQTKSALDALKGKFATLDDATADSAAYLLSQRAKLIGHSREITNLEAAGERIRIHGDYHLGQTLRVKSAKGEGDSAGGDFVLLDFEGEPARTLAERRRKQSPLKDVAGMLRSFSYAAFAGLKKHAEGHAETASDRMHGWARAWQDAAASEFLSAYRETIAAKPELLPGVDETQKLLDAYLLEKALYELLYELNNRPTWLHIPITGILSLQGS
ncbi:maltose alpha-D-glucosyltransferase [Occallatibacter savannae]|uniref:maltose alpha-D-glucosyltransferase n=1 Tax=Occallatibacter savannae TaxID=1002691 RepID=UPI000D69D140|nr:maltose alpha-D-glucosyltransferase [Occallatibacter savannae]